MRGEKYSFFLWGGGACLETGYEGGDYFYFFFSGGGVELFLLLQTKWWRGDKRANAELLYLLFPPPNLNLQNQFIPL